MTAFFTSSNTLSRLFLLLQLPFVESQLFSFNHIAVSAPALTRTGRNACQQPSALKLVFQSRIQFLPGEAVLLLGEHVPTSLFSFVPRSAPYLFKYHCLNGCASTCTIVFFSKVFVRTSSLLVALYTTSTMRTLRVQFSEPHAKFPLSSRKARYFRLPPRQRTTRTRLAPILVIAIGRPISYFLFFWWMFRRPPVLRCLWL